MHETYSIPYAPVVLRRRVELKKVTESNRRLTVIAGLYIYQHVENTTKYIGKCHTSCKKRHSNHKREIKNEIGGMGHHYGGSGGCGYENVSIKLIEEVELKVPG